MMPPISFLMGSICFWGLVVFLDFLLNFSFLLSLVISVQVFRVQRSGLSLLYFAHLRDSCAQMNVQHPDSFVESKIQII